MSDQYDPDFSEQVPPPPPGPPSGGAPPPPPAPNRPTGPRPDEEVRMWTLIAHASAFPAAFFALAFLGPLVVWLMRKDVDYVSSEHAKEALNFNLTVTLYAAVSFVLVFAIIGVVLLPLVGLFWLVNVIRALVAVNDGRTFRYPATIRFL